MGLHSIVVARPACRSSLQYHLEIFGVTTVRKTATTWVALNININREIIVISMEMVHIPRPRRLSHLKRVIQR